MLNIDIKTLINILEESEIDELEVSTFWGKQKIRLRKSSSSVNQNTDLLKNIPNQMHGEQSIPQSETIEIKPDEVIEEDLVETDTDQNSTVPTENTLSIKAPLVGTFYKSPNPDIPPFISEGDEIKQGQVICIIEAMKIFNEIESEYSGKILKILVEDATPVEYDQALFLISTEH